MTDADDLFFHYTSIPITPERFNQLTKHIDVMTPVDTTNPRPPGLLSRASGDFRVPMRPKNSEQRAKLGFHHHEGTGGVVGVIGIDYMDGVIREPERYKALLEVKRQAPPKPVQVKNASRAYPTHPGLDEQEIWDVFMKRSPTSLDVQLSFVERVMFRTYTSVPIPFEETPKSVLRLKIQHQYNEMKLQANACQKRLEAVMAEVTKKNVGLLALLDRFPVSKKHFNRPHPHKEEDPDDMDESTFELRYLDKLIPPKPVYEMKIPIQVPPKKPVVAKPKFLINTKSKRVSQSTSERYRAQYMVKSNPLQ